MDHLPSPPLRDSAASAASCHLVAVPYPGRGHVNPMMCLCRLLAARGALITFVVTEEWLALLEASPGPPPPPGVRLRTVPNVIPSEFGRAANFSGFLEAVYTRMGGLFELLLDDLERRPDAIVADSYLPWAVDAGNRRGIPVASLFTMPASYFSVMYHLDRIPAQLLSPAVDDNVTGEELLAEWIPGLTSFRLADLQSLISKEIPMKKSIEAFAWIRKAQVVLFTSFYELEPRVFDSLKSELSCPVYPIGPCIPHMMPQVTKLIPHNGTEKDYLSWLESQAEQSVLYVSLGSFLHVSNTQMEEIAMGLLSSGTKFLWVARRVASMMEEMCGKMGLVVPWCDQLNVLQHPSVGGFLSHCGFNSTMEAVFAGVPILTLPIAWDQLNTSRLIVEELKVGLSLNEKKEKTVGRDDIAMLVKRLMDSNGVESKEMRRRAKELQVVARKAIEEGGISHTNLNSFLSGIMKHNYG